MSDSECSFGWVPVNNQESDYSEIDEKVDLLDTNIDIKQEKSNSSFEDANTSHYNSIQSAEFSNETKPNGFIHSFNENRNDEILETYFNEHPHSTLVFNGQKDISLDNEDLWLLQCSHDFEIQSLIGMKILDNPSNKIKIPHSKFECSKIENDPGQYVTIILPPSDVKPCTINEYEIKGKFVIREKIKKASEIQTEKEETTAVPFPSNLKTRHPLFGGDYKKRIKLSNEIADKLANLPKPSLKHSKKDKVKNVYHEAEPIKCKRKRKSSSESKNDEVKSKTTKLEGMWENETTIEKNLFELPISKKRKKSHK